MLGQHQLETLQEEIYNLNHTHQGERFYALVHSPHGWIVRSLDIKGNQVDQPAQDFWNECMDDTPYEIGDLTNQIREALPDNQVAQGLVDSILPKGLR